MLSHRRAPVGEVGEGAGPRLGPRPQPCSAAPRAVRSPAGRGRGRAARHEAQQRARLVIQQRLSQALLALQDTREASGSLWG